MKQNENNSPFSNDHKESSLFPSKDYNKHLLVFVIIFKYRFVESTPERKQLLQGPHDSEDGLVEEGSKR